MKKTILIVDDEADMRDLLKGSLEQFAILEAPHGRSALAMVASGVVDLVVTDIFMPEMDGLELIQLLKAQAPGLPIIAVSGGGRFDIADSQLSFARFFGADALLLKPFDAEQLELVVQRLLQSPGDSAQADARERARP